MPVTVTTDNGWEQKERQKAIGKWISTLRIDSWNGQPQYYTSSRLTPEFRACGFVRWCASSQQLSQTEWLFNKQLSIRIPPLDTNIWISNIPGIMLLFASLHGAFLLSTVVAIALLFKNYGTLHVLEEAKANVKDAFGQVLYNADMKKLLYHPSLLSTSSMLKLLRCKK